MGLFGLFSKKPKTPEFTPEQLYQQGMALFEEKLYDEAFTRLDRAFPQREGDVPSDAVLALAWMCENGKGTLRSDGDAFRFYDQAARSGSPEGMAGAVRVTVKQAWPSLEALDRADAYEERLHEAGSDLWQETWATALMLRRYKVEKLAKDEQDAEHWSAEFQYSRGLEYDDGLYVPKDPVKALYWYEKAAARGHADAQYNTGWMYSNGEGTPKDETKAREWYEKAAAQDEIKACYNLAVLHNNGGRAEEALYWFYRGAALGDLKAKKRCRELMDKASQDAVFARAEREAGEGSVKGQFLCGFLYSCGIPHVNGSLMKGEMIRDIGKAIRWYEQAARQGYALAQLRCAELYRDGDSHAGNAHMDREKAFYWCGKAAEQGMPEAQYEYGKMYDFGIGVESDRAKAMEWVRKAADQNYGDAQWWIGDSYEYAKEKDLSKALEWYLKGAKNGSRLAQRDCGRMYLEGEGMPVDRDKARYWLEKAAKQGDPDAERKLRAQFGAD